MNIDPHRLPLGRSVQIHLCVRQGMYAETDGRLYAAQIDDCLRLMHPDLDEGIEAVVTDHGESAVTLAIPFADGSEHRDIYVLGGYRCYVGNMAWDAGVMGPFRARRFITALLSLGFIVEECVEAAIAEDPR